MAKLKVCPVCYRKPDFTIQEGENHLPYWFKCENAKCNIEIEIERGETGDLALQFWNIAVKLYKLRKINSSQALKHAL